MKQKSEEKLFVMKKKKKLFSTTCGKRKDAMKHKLQLVIYQARLVLAGFLTAQLLQKT